MTKNLEAFLWFLLKGNLFMCRRSLEDLFIRAQRSSVRRQTVINGHPRWGADYKSIKLWRSVADRTGLSALSAHFMTGRSAEVFAVSTRFDRSHYTSSRCGCVVYRRRHLVNSSPLLTGCLAPDNGSSSFGFLTALFKQYSYFSFFLCSAFVRWAF